MKKIGNLKATTVLVLLVAALLVTTVFTAYIHHKAEKIGTGIGETNGKLVGTAIGSARGVTVGSAKGIEDGTNAGLSAEETVAEIKGSMENLGNLEVLVAGVSLKNMHEVGDAYKALYIIKGEAVFSVNMSGVEISFSQDGKDIYVTIPEPEIELYLDQNGTEKLAEIQNFSFTVSAKEGLTAYLNTMTETVENVKETMGNYESLFSEAKELAERKVEQLVTTICRDNYVVHVQFK